MGNADTSLDHESINFIKKNEGYRETSYFDKNGYAICYGSRILDGKKVVKGQKATKGECEKAIYNHYFKWVKPYMPSGLYANQYVSLADTSYQYFHTVLKKKNVEKYIKSYPERGRWKKYQGTQLGDIY